MNMKKVFAETPSRKLWTTKGPATLRRLLGLGVSACSTLTSSS